ncbi:cytochrome c [Nitrosomonas communis]|uniref:c-type cytochrome n=1 Tax=Nitrosomonas communis TaxID=44574 RepID=UPI0026F18401|nr:cytochrome c [Nitrosomonas communis]MCO6427087.1 cytochrome c [Nitrosomonas communis]
MKILMIFRAIAVTLIGIMLMSLSTGTFAEDKLDIGKIEYEAACAVCHGLTGKGDDSPLKELLVRPVPNLTVLARNNKGVFPFDRVYQIIDGREEVKAHGPRTMPVWGNTFNRQSSIFFENYPLHDRESAARSRILALTEYIYRLQE